MYRFLFCHKDIKDFPCLVRGELLFPEPTLPFWELLWKEDPCASLSLEANGLPRGTHLVIPGSEKRLLRPKRGIFY